jgi:micrococcal nuclease
VRLSWWGEGVARRWSAPTAVLLVAGMVFVCAACSAGDGGPAGQTGWDRDEGVSVDSSDTGIDGGIVFPSPPASAVEVGLVKVVDGDTIRVRMPDGTVEKVRYIGIDTPEVGGSGGAGEYLGDEATARNEELLEAGHLVIETDVEVRDRFGRMLAYVWADGVFVNGRLALEGYARVHSYKPNLRYQPVLRAAEQKARDTGVGIWGNEAPRR